MRRAKLGALIIGAVIIAPAVGLVGLAGAATGTAGTATLNHQTLVLTHWSVVAGSFTANGYVTGDPSGSSATVKSTTVTTDGTGFLVTNTVVKVTVSTATHHTTLTCKVLVTNQLHLKLVSGNYTGTVTVPASQYTGACGSPSTGDATVTLKP